MRRLSAAYPECTSSTVIFSNNLAHLSRVDIIIIIFKHLRQITMTALIITMTSGIMRYGYP